MGRFSNSWQTVKASWGVLRKDKELMLFPVFSGLASLIIVVSFVAPTWFYGLLERAAADDANAQTTVALLYFVMYLVLSFVTIYFNSALIFGATERLAGGDPTIGSSLRGANKRLGKIFAWSMFAGTVSLLIHLLERATRGRNQFIAHFVVQLVGVAWTLATYFAVPIVLFEDERVFGSLRRSGQLFRKTWGESVIGEYGIGLVFGILSFLVVLATFALAYVLGAISLFLALAVILAGVVAFALVTIAGLALGAIYKAALYRYAAQGEASPGFPQNMVAGAFQSRA
jgi:uncharacterized protein DUF6159